MYIFIYTHETAEGGGRQQVDEWLLRKGEVCFELCKQKQFTLSVSALRSSSKVPLRTLSKFCSVCAMSVLLKV